MELHIKSFKTFNKISIEIKPLTILIGPPASGKSNLLEAIALLGFPGRLLALSDQYSNPHELCKAEPMPHETLRIDDALEVFPWMDYRGPATLELRGVNRGTVTAKLVLEGNKLYAEYEAKPPSTSLPRIPVHNPQASRTELCDAIIEASLRLRTEEKTGTKEQGETGLRKRVVEARLYGYERYGIETRPDETTRCEDLSCMQPHDILAETGYNLAYIASASPIPIRWLQEWLREDIGAPIEIRVRTRKLREILFFSKETEVPSRLLSDTLLRILYYTLALYSAARYTKRYSLNGRMLVLLEEPEARAFPYSFEVIAKAIRYALDAGTHVVLTTHNGLLLSKLLDTAKEHELAVYYTYIDDEGYTQTARVDIARLAEKMLLLEDLLVMKPKEVLQELDAAKNANSQ